MPLSGELPDPFKSRDKIPRTPPSMLNDSFQLRPSICAASSPTDNLSTSMFQTDLNRSRFFIKWDGSPLARRKTKSARLSHLNNYMSDKNEPRVLKGECSPEAALQAENAASPQTVVCNRKRVLSPHKQPPVSSPQSSEDPQHIKRTTKLQLGEFASTPKRPACKQYLESTPVTLKRQPHHEDTETSTPTVLSTVIKRPTRRRRLEEGTKEVESSRGSRYNLRNKVSCLPPSADNSLISKKRPTSSRTARTSRTVVENAAETSVQTSNSNRRKNTTASRRKVTVRKQVDDERDTSTPQRPIAENLSQLESTPTATIKRRRPSSNSIDPSPTPPTTTAALKRPAGRRNLEEADRSESTRGSRYNLRNRGSCLALSSMLSSEFSLISSSSRAAVRKASPTTSSDALDSTTTSWSSTNEMRMSCRRSRRKLNRFDGSNL